MDIRLQSSFPTLARLGTFIRRHLGQALDVVTLFRSRLEAKLIAILVAVVLVGMIFSSVLVLSLQRQQLMDSARSSSARVANAIQASFEHAMLTNDTAMLDEMIDVIVGETGLERVRILDMDGRVLHSSVRSEKGYRFDPSEPLCSACHRESVDSASQSTIPTSRVDGATLLNINVIANQPACYACHGSSTRPLGLLLIETPLTDLRTQLRASLGRIVLSALTTFALLLGLMIPMLGRFVIQPVQQLAQGAAEIGTGNLDYQCRVDRDDELGELATAFDTMRQKLKAALLEKERRNQELQMLHDIVFAASQLLDPQQILDLTIHIAVSSLGVEAGAIYLLDRDCGRFTLHACQGMSECREMACSLYRASRVLASLARPDGKVVSMPATATDTFNELWYGPQGCSYVGVPLEAKGVLLGVMTLITGPERTLTEEGGKTLKAVGQEIGVALANAIRFQNARYQATLEERDRLAREMHDSLAQALGYLKLQASVTDELLSGGQIAKAQANLHEVKEIAGETYFDVREAIFGLRHTAMQGAEFLPALEEYLAEYRTHYGLNVHLKVSDGCSPSFPAEVSTQIIRIVQEALTNVRKHARANQACVHFERDDHHWRITVEDDGQGFDLRQAPKQGQQSLGLHIMRERAESVGAQLEIDSRPYGGTQVILRVPLSPKK